MPRSVKENMEIIIITVVRFLEMQCTDQTIISPAFYMLFMHTFNFAVNTACTGLLMVIVEKTQRSKRKSKNCQQQNCKYPFNMFSFLFQSIAKVEISFIKQVYVTN